MPAGCGPGPGEEDRCGYRPRVLKLGSFKLEVWESQDLARHVETQGLPKGVTYFAELALCVV